MRSSSARSLVGAGGLALGAHSRLLLGGARFQLADAGLDGGALRLVGNAIEKRAQLVGGLARTIERRQTGGHVEEQRRPRAGLIGVLEEAQGHLVALLHEGLLTLRVERLRLLIVRGRASQREHDDEQHTADHLTIFARRPVRRQPTGRQTRGVLAAVDFELYFLTRRWM